MKYVDLFDIEMPGLERWLRRARWAGMALMASLMCVVLWSGGGGITARANGAERSIGPTAVARGTVEVEGGLVTLSPPSGGTVSRLAVKEGDRVSAGAVMFELDDTQEQLAVTEALHQLAASKAELKSAQNELPLLVSLARRMKQAVEKGGIAGDQLDQSELARQRGVTRVAIARADVDRATSAHDAAVKRAAQRIVRAPAAGIVARVYATDGVYVTPDRPAMILVPDRALQVRAEVNEYFVDMLHPDMAAEVVRDSAVEGPRLVTKVLRMSPVFRDSLLQDRAEGGSTRVVDVIVALPDMPEMQALRIGQQVRVKFYE